MTKLKVSVNSSIGALAGKSDVEIEHILKSHYTSVESLQSAFIVSAEEGPLLVFWDAKQHDWVGVLIQYASKTHSLKEDGSY